MELTATLSQADLQIQEGQAKILKIKTMNEDLITIH